MAGKVYLIGAGPGPADLITLRGARVLAHADIVFHDALVHADTLALATHARKIAVGKRCGKHSTAQRFINKMLIDAAAVHPAVVRLKGGDPMIFGRAQEEIDALIAAGVEVEVVPGITAALAASADLGLSLTQRGISRSVTFVTPRVGAEEQPGQWVDSALAADTAVIYMGAGEAAAIAAALRQRGKAGAMPVAIVENAALPKRRVWYMSLHELAQFDSAQIVGPALIIVGDVLRGLAATDLVASNAVASQAQNS